MDEYGREPCPHRIYADAGSAFTMGLIGGSVFHGFKGYRNAPKGYTPRFKNMLNEIRLKSPVTGTQFAAWGGMFSTIDCLLVYTRKKEDPWNSIAAGTMTGGLLAARMGWKTALVSATVGGLILGLIEGMMLVTNKFASLMYQPPTGGGGMPPPDEPPFSLFQSIGVGGVRKGDEELGM